MEIPYTLTARPDTGLYNGKLGIWLFLASEVMLFGAIFTAYLFVRLGADDGSWPNHIQNVWLGLTNTILLLTSSITMVWAWVALKERKFNTYRLALGLTILCGVVFLGIKGVEYHSKYDHCGFMIKEPSFDKYQAELDKANVLLQRDPRRARLRNPRPLARREIRETRSPSCPTKIRASAIGGKNGPVMNTAASEEDSPSSFRPRMLIVTAACSRPMAPTTPSTSSSPASTPCTSSAASSS